MSTFQLPQLLFGRLISDELEADEPEVLASSSPALGLHEARAWQELVSLAPFSAAVEDYAIGIFADPAQGEWLLARCHYRHADRQFPTLQFIPLPAALIEQARGGSRAISPIRASNPWMCRPNC